MSMPTVIEQLINNTVREAYSRRVTPRATYRLQLHAGFTLRDALEITPYLHRLGVSHLYLSSLAMARPGSLHGYDVIDHQRLNPELGTTEDLVALVAELRQRGMGILLDFVPNHMYVGPENAWWNDVLENGPSSPFATYFDIAWHDHPRERLRGKVLLPILDEPYGKSLEAGRFQLQYEHEGWFLRVHSTRLPIDPRTYGLLLGPVLDALKITLPADDPTVLELQSILAAIRHLPGREETNRARVQEGLAEISVVKRRLQELADKHPLFAETLVQIAQQVAGQPGDEVSFAGLAQLLDAQAYRPCFWRVALDEINYRRFFDINELAAVSTEREEVFAAIHAQPFAWIQQGLVDGLRIDHVDGLLDPDEYLQRLQHHRILLDVRCQLEADPAPHEHIVWEDLPSLVETALQDAAAERTPLYVVVEKILGSGESLPPHWKCDGTTGYDVLNEINGIFINPMQGDALEVVYHHFIQRSMQFDQLVHDAKIQVMQSLLASELHMLAHRLDRLAQQNWSSQDFTLNGLRHALREVIACFPVYRSYVAQEASASDRAAVLLAVYQARGRDPLLGHEVFQFIAETLLLQDPHCGSIPDDYRTAQREVAGKFQQLTAPVMAKGAEDTAIYRFNRLLSVNEVGGDPTHFGRSPGEVHDFLRRRANDQPGALSPLTTHDTKRSEDVRARLNILSEWPDEWGQRVSMWSRLNRPHIVTLEDGTHAPDANEEYLLYQTLVGAWLPELTEAGLDDFVKRIQAYMTKALREAKVHSSWINPVTTYDAAVSTFVTRILDPSFSAEFLDEFRNFVRHVHRHGSLNSLAQTLIRCTAPGIPDTYQGTEFFDYSLVDPDNRRPVDYLSRAAVLDELDRCEIGIPPRVSDELGSTGTWDAAKLFVVSRSLRLRAELPDVFACGEYMAVEVQGPQALHLYAYLRMANDTAVLVVVPRLTSTLPDFDIAPERASLDAHIKLPTPWSERNWRDVFTGRDWGPQPDIIPAEAMRREFPIALWVTHRCDT